MIKGKFLSHSIIKRNRHASYQDRNRKLENMISSIQKSFKSFQFTEVQCALLLIVAVFLGIVLYGRIFTSYEGFEKPTNITYYYMEKCKYCKEFNPVWNEFVQKYEGKIILKKISMEDAGNDLDRFNINSFPTVVMYNEKGDYKVYDGPRTVKQLLAFADNKN